VVEDLILEVDRLRRRQTVLEIAVGFLAVIVALGILGSWWVVTGEPQRTRKSPQDAPPAAGEAWLGPASGMHDSAIDIDHLRPGGTREGDERGQSQTRGDREEPAKTSAPDDRDGDHKTEHFPQ